MLGLKTLSSKSKYFGSSSKQLQNTITTMDQPHILLLDISISRACIKSRSLLSVKWMRKAKLFMHFMYDIQMSLTKNDILSAKGDVIGRLFPTPLIQWKIWRKSYNWQMRLCSKGHEKKRKRKETISTMITTPKRRDNKDDNNS